MDKFTLFLIRVFYSDDFYEFVYVDRIIKYGRSRSDSPDNLSRARAHKLLPPFTINILVPNYHRDHIIDVALQHFI